MRDRTADILAATVREFIETGIPVSSAHLYDKYDFGIKPASIRIELTDLTDAGFLEQPHHAAGRVPSDRGYSFYADRAIQGAVPGRTSRYERLVEQSAWERFADLMAEEIGAAAVVADREQGYAWTRGVPSLVQHLDWDTRDELAEILRDIEAVQERIDTFRQKLGRNEPQVFIGKGSPFGSSPLAAVAAEYWLDGRPITLIAVGPKRMDYVRAAHLFSTLARLTHQEDP